jgi:hypothetical protein
VQFTLPAVIEQPERGVAALLDFRQHDTGAERVDGAGRDEDDIACGDWTPLHQVDDRAGGDRRPQFLRRYPALQTNADLRVRFRRKDVPGFALAVWHSDRAGEGVVRMDLDRQWLAREQQLKQQRCVRSVLVGPLEPQFPDGVTRAVDVAPWLEIADAPRLVQRPHGRVFDGHGLSSRVARTPERRDAVRSISSITIGAAKTMRLWRRVSRRRLVAGSR